MHHLKLEVLHNDVQNNQNGMTKDIFSKIVTALHLEGILEYAENYGHTAYRSYVQENLDMRSKQLFEIGRDWTYPSRVNLFYYWAKNVLYNYIFEGVYISRDQIEIVTKCFWTILEEGLQVPDATCSRYLSVQKRRYGRHWCRKNIGHFSFGTSSHKFFFTPSTKYQTRFQEGQKDKRTKRTVFS